MTADLSGIRSLHAGITPGPTEVIAISSHHDRYAIRLANKQGYAELKKADADFFAAAPSTVARLLGIVERVEALAATWEEKAGRDSSAERAFGRQVVSVEFAVKSIRAAIAGEGE